MTKLVAVRVALAWATNVQTMLNDAKNFKKGIELRKNKRCDTQRLWKIQLCRWLTTHGNSDSKNISSPVEKLYIVCFLKKKLLGYRIDFGDPRLFLI